MELRALDAVAGYLRCPVCREPVQVSGGQLVCERRHGFDIARQGYASLIGGRGGPGTGDTAEMVAARERFLGGGHYRPLATALARLAAEHQPPGAGPAAEHQPPGDGVAAGHQPAGSGPATGHQPPGSGVAAEHEPDGSGLVVDLAGGTGYYLAAVLDALPRRYGVALDLSAPALRRAARAHPRGAAIGADVWQPLPLADGSAALMLSVFGPRNAAETRRVLRLGGALIVATPGAGHLRELREPLGMIGIEEGKPERLADEYREFAESGGTELSYRLPLGHAEVAAVVAMGPSARHIPADALASRIGALPQSIAVTVELRIQVFTHCHDSTTE
jgi:23S rRNA (guanine745-N1)-methyltransferase